MANTSFRIKTHNDFNTIYYRVRLGRSGDYEIALNGFVVPKDRWSSTKQRILSTKEIDYNLLNRKLSELDFYINSVISSDFDNKIKYSNAWLRAEVNSFLDRYGKNEIEDYKIYISDFFYYYKNNILPNEKGFDGFSDLSEQTKKNFNSAFSKFQKFESFVFKNKITFKDFQNDLFDVYTDFLFNEEKLSVSTITKYCKTLVTVLSKAFNLEYLKTSVDYKPKRNKSKDVKEPYLSFDEIDIILNTKFEDNGYLDNARDWLIIGCETGLRVSDLLVLSDENIIDDDFISLITKKTKERVKIPISKRVKGILNKHNGFPRSISSQKFNKYIKVVCEKAGVNQVISGEKLVKIVKSDGTIVNRKVIGKYKKYELISSHSCRRSFATNWYKLGIIPNHIIMTITGHKSEAVFLNYIKVTNDEKINEFTKIMKELGR